MHKFSEHSEYMLKVITYINKAKLFVEKMVLSGDREMVNLLWGFPDGSAVKNLPAVQETQETSVQSWVRKIPWRRAWQPIPVFLPGECHGQRSLAGYSPRGRKELDTAERLTTTIFLAGQRDKAGPGGVLLRQRIGASEN